ncbi:MAG: caspase family protein, partial [Bacteroidota bacterium]
TPEAGIDLNISVNVDYPQVDQMTYSFFDYAGFHPMTGDLVRFDNGITNDDGSVMITVNYHNPQNQNWTRSGATFQSPENIFVDEIIHSPSGRLGTILGRLSDERSLIFVYDFENDALVARFQTERIFYGVRIAYSKDESQIAIPLASGSIDIFDLQNQSSQIIRNIHQSSVRLVTFTDDPNQFISSGSDGKTIIWNKEQGGKILATLIPLNEKDWVVMSPNGLFDASPGAMEDLYYIVYENGKKETIELESLKPRYYEPGLLQKQLGYSEERLREVETLREIDLFPTIDTRIENDLLEIGLTARSGGIGEVDVFINGKEVVSKANPEGKTTFNIDLRLYQKFLYRHPDSTNLVGVQVYNKEGWLKSPIQYQKYKVTAWQRGNENSGSSWVANSLPKMYVLTIGTANYTGTNLDLKYSDIDAVSIANAMKSAGSQLFNNGDSLEVYTLTTDKSRPANLIAGIDHEFSSKENILNTLDYFQKKAKAEDIVLIYLSGHGVTYGSAEKAQFYYLTHGVSSEDLSDKAIREKYALSSNELTGLLNKIPALKQVLMIDACNSGKVVEDLTVGTRTLNSGQIRALDRMKDRTGMFVLSGSAADKVSYEASEYGQGLLTYSLLQGMQGLATRRTAEGNYVDVVKLFQFARDEVPRLASTVRGIQTPMLGIPRKAGSFDIGIVNESVDIQLNKKKPILIRGNFLNKELGFDNLKLSKYLEKEFLLETEKGKDANFLYIDVNEKQGAYKLTGFYTSSDGQIQFTPKLIKDEQLVSELTVRPSNDPERLASNIVQALIYELSKTQ